MPAARGLRHRRGVLALDERAAVMGVLNVTPDSFSDGGRFADADEAVEAALAMVAEGADIVDVGGESTRPGAAPVPLEEELRRVVPVVRGIRAASEVVVSVDTSKAAVARAAAEAGADIVNDVSAGTFDPAMLDACAAAGVGVVLMHTPGRPDAMDRLARYEDVVEEVRAFLGGRVEAALRAGIAADGIAVDPGFGFGKDPAANYALLRGLDRIGSLGRPVLVGVSRKRMIRAVVGTEVHALDHGTTAIGALALAGGASILRVHDVAAGRACVAMCAAALSTTPR